MPFFTFSQWETDGGSTQIVGATGFPSEIARSIYATIHS
jgi:hypothetical protein